MLLRTFLFAPGDHPRRVEKVTEVGADAVILDLEDAVAVSQKEKSRPVVVAALARPRRCKGYIRINAMDTPFCYGDLVAVVRPNVDGIILPKIETAESLLCADWLIGQLERENGLPPKSIDLIPIIETGKGVDNITPILRCGSRIRRVAFGAGDFTLDVGMEWSAHESELSYARSAIVTASRAAGLEPPVDTVWVRLDDEEGLKRSAAAVQGMGFQGKMCIHPRQVPIVNGAFTPSEAEVGYARRVVEAFREAERAGKAAFQIEGKFIDYPIVYRAQRTLDIVEAINRTAS